MVNSLKKSILNILIILTLIITIIIGCKNNEEQGSQPMVKPEWARWIKNNHQQINHLDADNTDYSDLLFLKSLLEGKRLVQLGENSHGVSEFNQAKVRLIKFLHKNMDFDIIAFESSIFECNVAQQNINQLSEIELMGQSVFAVWHCEETLKLFEYIKETQSTNRPLILAGFDVQISSSVGAYQRPEVFAQVISIIDDQYAQEILENDREFVDNRYQEAWLASNANTFKTFYKDLYLWFDQHMQTLLNHFAQSPLMPKILRQTAWSMGPYIDCLLARNNLTEYYNLRDQGMAKNVDILLNDFYKGKKMIVWAHNGHIQHHDSPIHGGGPIAPANNMGYWLSRWFAQEIYTVGFFMYEGQAASAMRQVHDLGDYQANSLEAIFAHTESDYSFVNLLGRTMDPGNSWMFEYIITTEWEDAAQREDETIIPKDHFNGILFIRNVHPPDYLTYIGLRDPSL
jgi:erythromycin esterase